MNILDEKPVRFKEEINKKIANPIDSPARQGFNLSRFNFLERSFKYFGAGVASHIVSQKILPTFMTSEIDWCPVFSKSVYIYARKACVVKEMLPGLSGIFNDSAFKTPIVEELIFRMGLQEILLKRLPKAILQRIAPCCSHIIDTKIAKVARVSLSAVAFSLIHARPPVFGWPECSTVKLISSLIQGLILGGIQEATASPLMGMLFHSGFNIQHSYLLEQMGVGLECAPLYLLDLKLP